jgi:hypothetical protein
VVGTESTDTVFRVLVILSPTLYKLQNNFSSPVRKREKIDMNILGSLSISD